jgi:hypothetical protein
MLEPQSAEELTWQDVLRVGALLGSQAEAVELESGPAILTAEVELGASPHKQNRTPTQ